jgi:gamma-glutamylcyclotransferase (GGCT)/AIG2-like uncharacterized protein YtfP
VSALSEKQCRLLFVYGSLRRGFELHDRLLQLGAEFVTEAKIAGHLVDLGSYPGARPTDREGNWVYGELFQLCDPERDLQVLDEVEEVIPGPPEAGEYVRAITEAILKDDAKQEAWIYWLRVDAPAARVIASGDYAQWREKAAPAAD